MKYTYLSKLGSSGIVYKIWLAAILFSVSCKKDFLDRKPLDKISEADVWKDARLIENYIYRAYRTIPFGNDIPNNRTLSCLTDEANRRSNAEYNIVTAGNVTSTTLGPLDLWQGYANATTGVVSGTGYYNVVSFTNVFFDNIENAPIEASIKNRMTGEMKVMRAFAYLQLAGYFGGVPLITKSFNLHDDYNIPRNSYAEVMDFVVKELDEAAALLPLDYDAANKGRITRGAALGIKSRALLYAASPLNNPTNDMAKWQKAADAAKAVIDLNKYALYQDYKTMFLETAMYNSEIIWTRPFNNQVDRENTLERSLYPNGYGGFGQVHPLQNLVEDYETRNGKLQKDDPTYDLQKPYDNLDPRFYATILYDGAPMKGRQVETFLPGGQDSNEGALSPHNATQTGYYQRKFMNEVITNPTGTNNANTPWLFIRYGEILLNYAEASYHLGREDICRNYINEIRKRPSVMMPPVTESGNALLTRLQHERRIELAFEEHRWFDVRRWKIAPVTDNQDAKKMVIRKDASGNKTYSVEVFQDRNFYERNYLAPIPQVEINKNNKLEQNPGY